MAWTDLIDRLDIEGRLLADAAARAGWDAPVPGHDDWTVRDVVVHTGGVHRWAADTVATGRTDSDSDAGDRVGADPDVTDLLEWFRDGHVRLVRALRDAPAELDCFTFLPCESPRHFWARRQAHETTIHRVDVEGASDVDSATVPAAHAQDGIEELLLGFAARRSGSRTDPPGAG